MDKSPPKLRQQNQRDRFIETARELECDEDKERFEEKLGRIAGAKPPKKTEDKPRRRHVRNAPPS